MYSLKLQLLSASLVAAIGGLVTFYFHASFISSLIIFSLFISLAFGIQYFFFYRPVAQIRRAIEAQKDKNSVHRMIAHTSDEFQQISDGFNTLVDAFRSEYVQLEKLERVRSEFLGNVSHELRTPLFSTQGLIETLLHGAVDDKKVNKEFLKKALNNIDRLNSLLEELIDISRIESGEMKLRLRFFDIVSLLSSTVAEMQTVAEQRSVTVSLLGETKQSIDVYGDKERLRQVLVNLIENGIKYSEPKDSVVIRFEEKKSAVEISVEDTGIGISPQHLPRIFERFYRADKDRSREVGGSGLGLAIVKHIIEAHDSSIKVESEVGVGSKFTFAIKKSVIPS